MCQNCENDSNPIAAVLWRVSTTSQLELSPETQITATTEMLEKAGYDVPPKYVLGGEWSSMEIFDWPVMQELLKLMRERQVHAIGVINSDRLSGEMAQKLLIMDIARRNDVQLLGVQAPIESGPEGELLETVKTYAKQLQVMRARQGAKDGLRDRVQRHGLPATGKAPFGYRFPLINDAQDCSRLIPDDNWQTAKKIWGWGLDGISSRAIMNKLYQDGIKTPRGGDMWRPRAIVGMFHNPVYAGRYYADRFEYSEPVNSSASKSRRGKNARLKPIEQWTYLPGVEIEKPVVAWADFMWMQDRLQANIRYSKRNVKKQYLLRGFIRCEDHNRTYRGWDNGRYLEYKCLGVHGSEVVQFKCSQPRIPGKPLEDAVWQKAMDILFEPETLFGEASSRAHTRQETLDNLRDALKTAQKRLEHVDSQEMEFSSKWMRVGFSAHIAARQLEMLGKERESWQAEVTKLEAQLHQVEQSFVTVDQIRALTDRVGGRLADLDFDRRRLTLESLETAITVKHDGHITIGFLAPEFMLESPSDIALPISWRRTR